MNIDVDMQNMCKFDIYIYVCMYICIHICRYMDRRTRKCRCRAPSTWGIIKGDLHRSRIYLVYDLKLLLLDPTQPFYRLPSPETLHLKLLHPKLSPSEAHFLQTCCFGTWAHGCLQEW